MSHLILANFKEDKKMLDRFSKMILTVVFVMLFACYMNTAKARSIKEGLVSFWTLDKDTINGKTVEDVVGKNDGSIVGNPKIVDGKNGDALSFDGVVDYVKMSQDIEPESVTVEAVIKPVMDSRNPIYDKYNYGIQSSDGQNVGIWIRDDKVQWPSAYTSYPKDDDWHHVVGVVKDKEFVKIYLDGQLKKTTPATNPIDKAYSSLMPTIAYTQHLGGIWYHGIIDEVGVYDRALSDSEVRKLYAESMAVANPNGKLSAVWGQIKSGKAGK